MFGDIILTKIISMCIIFLCLAIYCYLKDLKKADSFKEYMETNDEDIGATLVCLVIIDLLVWALWAIWN